MALAAEETTESSSSLLTSPVVVSGINGVGSARLNSGKGVRKVTPATVTGVGVAAEDVGGGGEGAGGAGGVMFCLRLVQHIFKQQYTPTATTR